MIRTFTRLLLASSALVPFSAHAQELPSGGTVAAGSAVIAAPSPGSMTITQGSDRAIINWQSFSIGEDGRVDIRQPDTRSVLLNRVTGDTTSTIAGALNANGQVFLVNPNGILITSTGSVNAAGFVASTLDLGDDSFMRGDIVVTGKGGRVRNEGRISIVTGGYAALIGGAVDNAGLIAAPLGRVALGAGTRATLDLNGDGFLQVALPAAGEGGVTMSGRIAADGGSVLLTAASAVDAARNTVNLSGVIEARGVEGRNGSVTLTGPDIRLAGASIDVSGASGGGTVRIGGDRMGGGALAHAATLDVDAASTIRADATRAGDGGDIVLWSDETTRFAGTISARGAGGGDGGDAEVSSKGVLGYTGFTDLRGARFGTLLLDPYNVIISDATDQTSGGFVPTGDDSIINTTTLQNALASANVTIATGSSGSPGAQEGNITVAAPLTWSTPATLTLDAANAIVINAPINITGAGGIALNYNTALPTNLRFGAGGAIDYGAVDYLGTLSINGDAYKLIYSMAQLDAIDGVRNIGVPALVTPFGQGLAERYALATSLDAGGTTYTNALIAGAATSTVFSGVLEGLGHTIANLSIEAGASAQVGLIGRSSGTVRDIGLIGGGVTGRIYVGGLVGYNTGVITQSWTTGVVSGGDGADALGGLAGYNSGTVAQSWATGAVSGGDDAQRLGGLIGVNSGTGTGTITGTITQSWATGAVSGGDGAFALGGLVGYNFSGAITQSYATGAVSGGEDAQYLGGLIGSNSGTITQAYASGAVRGGDGALDLGGLVGDNLGGAITASYWDTDTSDQTDSDGGAGLTTAALQSGVLPAGFDPTVWGGMAFFNPYLQFQTTVFSSIAGDRAIDSGFAASVNALLAERNVVVAANGITVASLLSWSSDKTLSLDATGTLAIDVPIAVTGAGGVALTYDTALPTNLSFGADGTIDYGATDLGGRLSINGDAYTLIYSMADLDAIDGVENVGGAAVAGFGTGLAGHYALATSLDAGGTTYTNALVAGGGTTNTAPTAFSGTLEGLGHTISNLSIDAGARFLVGLIGHSSGTVRDIGLVGGGVSGGRYVGGLVGRNDGAITQSWASGAVSGGEAALYLGGLVGRSFGTITQSWATGTVSGGDGALWLGGLVGSNDLGTITQSYATGAVSGGGSALDLGGLVGYNYNGTITQSWATGAVSGGDRAYDLGGLVGRNEGTIAQSWATGAVSAGNNSDSLGGLVGYNDNGTITQSWATGAVSGGEDALYLGGLVGSNNGTITQSWASGAVSGGNDAQRLGGLVGSNDGAITQSYASGAVSGGDGAFALGGLVGYKYGGTVTQSWATGAVSGGEDAWYLGGLVGYNGTGTITQSYASGAVSGGAGALDLGGLVGGNGGGTVTASYWDTDTSGQADSDGGVGLTTAVLQSGVLPVGFDPTVWGGMAFFNPYLQFQTTVTSSIAGDRAIDSGFAASVNALLAERNVVVAANGITVASLLSWSSDKTLSLDATGTLAIDAPIAVTGAGGVALNYDAAAPTNLSFGAGGAIDYGATDHGGRLAINGDVYTLIYSMANLDAIDAVDNDFAGGSGGSITPFGPGLAGRYALATSLDAAGTIYTNALIAGGNTTNVNPATFSGMLEGLGHTISNLRIEGGANWYVGLIGHSSGMVRDIGLVGGGVSGRAFVGGLVGYNFGTIAQSRAAGAVSGGDGAQYLGGLAGANGGTIMQSWATGAVSGGNNVRELGGLVGYNLDGAITQSWATGVVSGGNGAAYLGGLAGISNSGTIVQSYATGAVSGGDNASDLGGLVGYNTDGTIVQSYATGAVSGGNGAGFLGGLVGFSNVSTITHSYWDTETSGQTISMGGGGLTTGQLQSGDLPGGFDPAVWATGAGLYPYLKSLFPDGVQVVSGFATHADGSAMASGANGAVSVSLASGGALAGSATTGANGYYYVFAPAGTWTDAAGVAVFTQADAATGAQDAVSYRAGAPDPGVNAGLDLTGGWRRDGAGMLATLSALDAGYAATIGAAAPSGFALANRQIATAVNFSLDQALSVGGTLWLSGSGGVTQSAALTAPTLLLTGTGDYGLNRAGNLIDSLAADAGGVDVASDAALTIAADVGDATGGLVSGVTTSQAAGVRVATSGDLTLASGARVSGADPVLMAGGAFINQQGGDAVTATNGRWLVYASGPAGAVFGDLDSGNTAVWNTAAGGAVSQTGDRYVFAHRPTLTITSTDATKTYGDDATQQIAGQYAITGYDPGVDGAYLGDTAATALTGAASVTSAGSAATADVAGSPYAITVAAGTLAAATGYALAFDSSGELTVAQRALSVTADALSRIYGDANPELTYQAIGLVNGDTLSGGLATGATQTSDVGDYAITQGGLANANYTISYQGADLTIGQRALSVSADALSRIYGDANPALTYQAIGLVNGDTLSGGLATSATQTSDVDVYAITQGDLANANYTISYQGADLTIGQRALTVTADALSRIYGDANPVTGGATGDNLVNGDTITSVTLGTSATIASGVGQYDLSASAATGTGLDNYAISYSTRSNGLTIGQRALSVTADALSRLFGHANPALTYQVGGQGLVNGDTLSGGLTTVATRTSDVGDHAITQGTLAASANYTVSFAPGVLTVLMPINPSAETLAGTQQRDAPKNLRGDIFRASTLDLFVDERGVTATSAVGSPRPSPGCIRWLPCSTNSSRLHP